MILRFSLGNFLSFKETQTVSFEASSLKDTTEPIYNQTVTGSKILKSLSVYGINSSGKSNLLKAFTFMKYWVINSFTDSSKISQVPIQPFLLNKKMGKENTFLEVIFLIENMKYRYGFELTRDGIKSEWLFYSEPKKREQNYFVRAGQEIAYTNSLRKASVIKIEPILSYTKPNVLFISVLAQFNIEIGNSILNWFHNNKIGFDFNSEYFINKTASLLDDKEYFLAIHELIKLANLGFTSVVPEKQGKYSSSEKISAEFLEFALQEEMDDYKVQTKHNVIEDDSDKILPIYFDLKRQESLGTQKFFAIAGALLMAIRNSNILWIDELDSKFHPLLFETIIKFFNSNRFNHKGSQLIFTTHSTQLLKEKILRRDQIYTVNKDTSGASTIKGMHNANVRIDAPYEKLYFDGKIGGIQKINLDDDQLSLF